MEPSIKIQKVNYLECQKGGFHFGESLNVVCMESCSACMEQNHKSHKYLKIISTKPLKMILYQAKQYSKKIVPLTINNDVLQGIIQQNRKDCVQVMFVNKKLHKLKVNTMDLLNRIEGIVNSFYFSIDQQIKIKTSKSENEFFELFNMVKMGQFLGKPSDTIKKLVNILPKGQAEQSNITQEQIIDMITYMSSQMQKFIENKTQQLDKNMASSINNLEKKIQQNSIWSSKINFKFDSKSKHPDITLLSPYIVKSSITILIDTSSIYKFSVMEPSLEVKPGLNKKFVFKIKEMIGSNNWIAVGMCHKKIVQTRNFNFSFGSVGHGAYMISSNGGSWSNTQSQFNNVVKAFKFAKNQIIVCEYDPKNKKINFTKKSTLQKYSLKFDYIQGNELYPCGLFFYINDQIEFMPGYKD